MRKHELQPELAHDWDERRTKLTPTAKRMSGWGEPSQNFVLITFQQDFCFQVLRLLTFIYFPPSCAFQCTQLICKQSRPLVTTCSYDAILTSNQDTLRSNFHLNLKNKMLPMHSSIRQKKILRNHGRKIEGWLNFSSIGGKSRDYWTSLLPYPKQKLWFRKTNSST